MTGSNTPPEQIANEASHVDSTEHQKMHRSGRMGETYG